jgi:hypothetical protein
MSGNARVPNERVPFDKRGKSPVGQEKVDPARMYRSAANTGGLDPDIDPLGGHEGVETMELLKFHVKISSNQARDPTGSLRVDEGLPAEGAGIKEAVGGPVRIAIEVIEPKGVPTTVIPDNSHQTGPQDLRDHGDAAATDNGCEEAGAISLGLRQEHLASGLPNDAKDWRTFLDPSLLDQCNVPL